ncbi:MAG: 30S ribosomal protein S20 [Bacteroidales bacterium]|nr:30S ribosomal protein S20 [Bacteroidales bacterium]
MANHKSALKRIRQIQSRKLHNRYYAKSMRNAMKNFRQLTDRKEAEEKLPTIVAMIDKLAGKRIIHRNKAANLKSKLSRKVNAL